MYESYSYSYFHVQNLHSNVRKTCITTQKKLSCHVTNLRCHGKKVNCNERNIHSKSINSYVGKKFLHIIAHSDVGRLSTQ